MSRISLRSLPFIGVLIILFSAAFFIIPSSFVTFQFSKASLVFFVTLIAFCFYIVSLLKRGQFDLPLNYVYGALLLIPVTALVSTFGSLATSRSFLGYGFEAGTFGFLITLSILLILASFTARSEKRLLYAIGAFVASVVLLMVMHITRFVLGPEWLSFGMFTSQNTSFVGSWYDVSMLCVALLLVALFAVELLHLPKRIKLFAYVLMVGSLGFLAIINFTMSWIVLACIMLTVFVFLFSIESIRNSDEKTLGVDGEIIHITKQKSNIRKISVWSLVVLVVSLVFVLPLGAAIGASFSSSLDISSIQVRPSWSATGYIAQRVIKDHPILGVGPNNFGVAWQQYRPDGINVTPFWNVDFVSGVGFVPTFIVTTGLLGIAAWIIFLALFLYTGFVSLFSREQRPFVKYATTTLFFVSLYFWIMAIFYVPSTALIALMFVCTGLFFAAAHVQGTLSSKTIAFASFPRASFAFVLGFVLLCVMSLALLYGFGQKVVSAYYFERGAAALRAGSSLDVAEQYFGKAIAYGANDVFYREYSALQISRLGVIVSSVTTGEVTEAVQNEFQRVLGNAIDAAQKAIAYNEASHENWVALGRVYEAVVPLGIPQAYENALQAYQEAIVRSPSNPQLNFVLARLEASRQNFTKAKEYIATALAQKSNYSEAIFLKSKIEVAEGDLRSAIASVENISIISPNDVGVFFELGLLKYNYKDYAGAVKAFERAVALVPEYANARYFLGLSYEKLGRRQLAIEQFEQILILNPGNAEIELIIENLRAGRSALADAEPPLDEAPEKRDELPLDEE